MGRLINKLFRDERGALLAEALVAVGVFTLLGTAVMTGVSATSAAAEGIQASATADTLASNQMSEILAASYQDPPCTFSTIAAPAGYTIAADGYQYIPGDVNIEKIVVSVSRSGTTLTTLESLRLKP